MERKIVECKIFEGRYENIIGFKYDDGTVNDRVRRYYPDEISFYEGEFIGLTEKQAQDLMYQRDLAYLRS